MFHGMMLGRIAAPLPDGMPTLDNNLIIKAAPPAALRRTNTTYQPEMDGNDKMGDCAVVGLTNAMRAQAAISGYQLPIQTDNVTSLYSELSGYVPSKPETDIGLVMVNVLDWQAKNQFHIGDGTQDGYDALWANIPADDLRLLQVATAIFGVTYLGVNLAEADQYGAGVWDTMRPNYMGDPKPGSWGGHTLDLWCWDGLGDSDMCYLATWGTLQRATWRWVKSRLAEAHLVYYPQLNSARVTLVDHDRLAADVQAFQALA